VCTVCVDVGVLCGCVCCVCCGWGVWVGCQVGCGVSGWDVVGDGVLPLQPALKHCATLDTTYNFYLKIFQI
jgi:hypothetical protein